MIRLDELCHRKRSRFGSQMNKLKDKESEDFAQQLGKLRISYTIFYRAAVSHSIDTNIISN